MTPSPSPLSPSLRRPLDEILPRPLQRIPGRVILFVTNPDGKIMVDPAAGAQIREGVARRMLVEEVADPDRLDLAERQQRSYTARRNATPPPG